jgi:hypothetical protein
MKELKKQLSSFKGLSQFMQVPNFIEESKFGWGYVFE